MKIALCLICKNEEKNIKRCLNDVTKIVDEIIIVDTGSTDKTVEYASQIEKVNLYEIEWENDFSKARNFAINKCKSDWIIFLDADEYIADTSLDKLRGIINKAERCKADYIAVEILNLGENGISSSFKTIRMFKNQKNVHYVGKIHEKLEKEKGNLKGIDESKNIKVYHTGYLKSEIDGKRKDERNLSLLQEALKQNPKSSDIHYYLMQEYCSIRAFDKAWEHGKKVIEYHNKTLSDLYTITYANFLKICIETKKDEQLTEATYKEALKIDAQYPDFDYYFGAYFFNEGHIDKAITYIERCVEKLQTYNGTALSYVASNILQVLILLNQMYLKEGIAVKAVPLMVKILNIDPYQLDTLMNLIKIIQETDSTSAIGGFLQKIYDMSVLKDQMVLLTVCKQIENRELFRYFWDRAQEEIKQTMPLW